MPLSLVTAPTDEPVTLEEAKEQLRIFDDTSNDVEIQRLISEGRVYIESMSGYALMSQTWDYYLDNFYSKIQIPKAPTSSITSIKYQDTDNAQQTLSTDYYNVDANAIPGLVTLAEGYSYPSVYPDFNSVVIRFVAGYADIYSVPEQFKRAIKMYIQWIFDADDSAKRVLDFLIDQNRVFYFGVDK